MKLLLFILAIGLSTGVMAQQSTTRNRLSDDGKTLSIQIDGKRDGRMIHYNRTFDVAGMNRLQKEVIKYRAFKSAGVTMPIHEVAGFVTVFFGLAAMVATYLIIVFQRRKAALSGLTKSVALLVN